MMVQILITYTNNDMEELYVDREDFTINDKDLTVFEDNYILKYVNLATVKTIDFMNVSDLEDED
jgi:hypothetical protein